MTSTRKIGERGGGREKCCPAIRGVVSHGGMKKSILRIYSRNESFLPRWLRISELRGLPRKVRSSVLAFEFLWREAGSTDDNIDPRM